MRVAREESIFIELTRAAVARLLSETVVPVAAGPDLDAGGVGSTQTILTVLLGPLHRRAWRD